MERTITKRKTINRRKVLYNLNLLILALGKTILVTPITRRLKRPELPCHVTLNDKNMVKLEVIIPVEKEKITGYYGKLTEKQMREVNQAMLIELGII